jgi:ligand-binding sensor domain-containing protein
MKTFASLLAAWIIGIVSVLVFTLVPPALYAQCGPPDDPINFTAVNGQIKDRLDSTVDEYDNDLDCFWLIRPPGAKQIRLTFTQFDTEEDYDFVTVYDGADTTARILGIFSGQSLPPTVVSTGGALLVRFTTDAVTQNLGWVANYFSSTQPVFLNIDPPNIVFSTTIFGATALDSCTISGSNLQGNFRLAAPVGFKLSTNRTGPFVDTLFVANTSPVVQRLRVYIQFTPPAPDDYSGRVFVWNSTGIASMTVFGTSPPAIYWEPTGGPYTGRVRSLALAAGNTILAGTFGGVYRSNSNGAAWLQSNDGLKTSAAQFINALITTSKGAFIGTKNGVYRSVNSGRSWQEYSRGLPEKTDIYALTGSGDTLFASTEDGLWMSANGSWRYMESEAIDEVLGDGSTYINALLWDNAHKLLVIGTANDDAEEGSLYRAAFDEELDVDVANAFSTGIRGQVQCLALRGNSFFAGTNGAALFRSDNVIRGSNLNEKVLWTKLDRGLTDDGGAFVYSIAPGTDVVYAATADGVFRSANNGDQWEQPASSRRTLTDQEQFTNTVLVNGADVYVGTDAGVYRSLNKAATWEPVNTGLTAAVVNAITDQGGAIVCGTAGSGIFRSTDNGITWSASNFGLRARFVDALASKGRDLYAVSYDSAAQNNARLTSGIFRSKDNGATWTQIYVDSTFVVKGERVRTPFHSIFTSPRGIFAGGDNGVIVRSNDNGATWQSVRFRLDSVFTLRFQGEDYLVTTAATFSRFDVLARYKLDTVRNVITTEPAVTTATVSCFINGSGTTLFAGTRGAGLYRTENNGALWVEVTLATVDSYALEIYSLTRNGNAIFAATDDGLYRSVTNGRTWTWLEAFPDTVLPNSMRVAGGLLYVGTAGDGVWRSSDDGLSFEKVGDGLNPDADVFSLAPNQGSDLYLGAGGNVVFRSSLQQAFNTSRAFLEIPDTLSAATGEYVDIPIIMRELQSRPQTLPSLSGVLRFNAALLDPVDETGTQDFRQEAVVGGERLIPFRVQLTDAPGRRLKTFRFRARLGNSVATPLTLTSLSAEGVIVLAPKPGVFTLKGLSEAGGTRLFRSDKAPVLLANAPNPASLATTLRYELTESGQTMLAVKNMFGQTVKSVTNTYILPGQYDVPIEVADLAPGVYFIVLQTPNHTLTQTMHIVR